MRHPAAAGWVVFAAADILQGIVALLKREVHGVADNGLIITSSVNAWGWSLLIWGIILVLAGGGFGRWFSIIVVTISLIGQFARFPAYPLWSLIAILLSAAVPWAPTAGRRDAQDELQSSPADPGARHVTGGSSMVMASLAPGSACCPR